MSFPASPFQALTKLIATPPPVLRADYDGLEYRWKIFTFRPALFTIEPYIILGLSIYLLAFFIGKTRNAKRANAWFDAHFPLLAQQFSKPTVAGLVPDGYSDFFSFSTGRRNIASLHVVFKLIPRHDLLQAAYQFARSCVELTYNRKDELELEFKLFSAPNAPSFVWAAVNKDYLPKIKDARWDLTFTRTTENAQLGHGFVVMSEYADVTENVLSPSIGLAGLLNNASYKDYIRSLSITDQPRERPTSPSSGPRERRVLLSLTAPPSSKADVTIQLVEGVFKLIDRLDSKVVLRPETKTKLKKVREELDENIKKEAVAEKLEEAENDKATAKRKAVEEKLSKLSASEQKKVLERERKRTLRKTQGKGVVRK